MHFAALIFLVESAVVLALIAIKQRRIHALEQELYILRHARLNQLYRLAVVGRATIGVLHDIANPITFSLLFIEQHYKKLSEVRTALELVSKLIENSRAQLLHTSFFSTFSPLNEIELATDFLHHKLIKNRVTCHISGDKALTIFGDRYKFYQCMSNLISNAIDAYATTDVPKRVIDVSLSKLTDAMQISIKDYGCGIDVKDQPQIFTPFFTSKSPNEGTGLGLAETKQFIEEVFHGTIFFKSKIGQGTIFTLVIPSSLPSQPPYATLDA